MQAVVALLILCVTQVCAKFQCLQCMAIQDSIRRSILANATAQVKKGMTPNVLVSDVIKDVCKSDSWKNSNYKDSVRKGCTAKVNEHHRTHTQFWGQKEDPLAYTDSSTRWIGYSVCTQPKLDACEHWEVDFGQDVEKNRCSICRAIAKDVYRITRMTKFTPFDEDDPGYAELLEMINPVCDDLPKWRNINFPVEDVIAECKIFQNDYRRLINKLLLERTANDARNFCNGIGVCQFKLNKLPFSDDGLDAPDGFHEDM